MHAAVRIGKIELLMKLVMVFVSKLVCNRIAMLDFRLGLGWGGSFACWVLGRGCENRRCRAGLGWRNVAPLAGGSHCACFQRLSGSWEWGAAGTHRFPLVQRGLLGVHNIARGFYIRLRGLCKGFTGLQRKRLIAKLRWQILARGRLGGTIEATRIRLTWVYRPYPAPARLVQLQELQPCA